LREAAKRLVEEEGTVLDIALDCGFGDVSNFNRAFRTEFGRSPLSFRTLGTLGTLGTPGTPGTSIKARP
jgi:AraC-like DNA-binding protein